MAACWRWARPARCSATLMSSQPISGHEQMSAPDTILKLSNIESYYGPIMAIRGISLEVARGQIVTLLGANGAGKTTVLKTISGILDPQKGTIEFLGKPIQRMEADKIVRLGLSHVPEGREVFPFLSVR